MKDSEVKQAFRQIMKIKQEANYFNDWPEDILDRVQIHTHITDINRNKVDLNLPAFLNPASPAKKLVSIEGISAAISTFSP